MFRYKYLILVFTILFTERTVPHFPIDLNCDCTHTTGEDLQDWAVLLGCATINHEVLSSLCRDAATATMPSWHFHVHRSKNEDPKICHHQPQTCAHSSRRAERQSVISFRCTGTTEGTAERYPAELCCVHRSRQRNWC